MANIGDKFIITIGDKAENAQSGEILYRIKGFKSLVFDENGIEKLEKYEAKKGEWYYNCQNGWHCSICHEIVKCMPTVMGKANFDFCPNCGAVMIGKKE